jgi:pyridoxine kinase
MARVLAISSHVARGHVGLAATVPALQWLGHEVWALPTIVLASRPGLGRFVKHDLPASDLEAMLAALDADGCWDGVDAVFTGYFASPAAVRAAAQAIRRIKEVRPQAIMTVDPVLGDAGRLYVSAETADAVRGELVPLATVATPNLFELQWLSRASPASLDEIEQAARGLGPPAVVVTSAAETPEDVTTLLVDGAACTRRSMPKRSGIPNGAGDLFAGLLLGHMLSARKPEAALQSSLESLDRVFVASEGQPVLQLSALMTGTR